MKNMKKQGFLCRKKNTFENKNLYQVLFGSLEFRVDMEVQPVYSGPVARLDFEGGPFLPVCLILTDHAIKTK